MAASKNKTQPTGVDVAGYLDGIANETRRKDGKALAAMMRRITGHKPRMWGPSIVGFGSVHYTYESGREGDMGEAGFAARKDTLVVYMVASGENEEKLLTRLGKHKMTKCCLYIRKLADVDTAVLEQLISESVDSVRRRYPQSERA